MIINKKQVIILLLIIFSFFNIMLFFLLYLFVSNNIKQEDRNNNIVKYNINFKKDNYYIGLNETIEIGIMNNDNINYSLYVEDDAIVNIENNKVTGLNNGSTELILTLPDSTVLTSNIHVVKGLVKRPTEFNYDKNYIEFDGVKK